MKTNQIKVIGALLLAAGIFIACSKSDSNGSGGTTTTVTTPNLPATVYNYNVPYPAHVAQALQAQDNTPAGNAITNDGATLGRVLFYDKNLSRNNTISCASCHSPAKGFSDDAIKSLGFNGGLTGRHSMPTLNLRFYQNGRMFWDERAATLEDQVLMPIQDTTEMGMTLANLVTKLQSVSYYPNLFQKAFGSSQITSDRISRALSQFLRSIVTYQSKYDRVKQGQESFTADEAAGEQLFNTPRGPGNLSCNSCHSAPMFITSNAPPFGLADPNDAGINGQNRFKSSTLRNVTQHQPLFHNGSVATLDAMLAGNIPAHGVPPQDRPRIIAFLRTLTDNTVSTEPRFADPFVR